MLRLLLERPGELVTREDIQKRIWPDDTYVEFDNAINSSIRK
ncbi:MAG: winged helix-turn-helix domain-containing protein [Acidobacteriaceae bacterium]|nr:winged helix-turn-helix domain-containing protein [Acidobacteriaceae bacterium]